MTHSRGGADWANGSGFNAFVTVNVGAFPGQCPLVVRPGADDLNGPHEVRPATRASSMQGVLGPCVLGGGVVIRRHRSEVSHRHRIDDGEASPVLFVQIKPVELNSPAHRRIGGKRQDPRPESRSDDEERTNLDEVGQAGG